MSRSSQYQHFFPNSGNTFATRNYLQNYSSTTSDLHSYTNKQSIGQSLVRPVHYRSVNVASSYSANVRWSSPDSVNFMDHLYFITNLVLDYLLENDLPQELMNKTLFDDPISVLSEHKNELISHFNKLLITACTCLCIGISIPLFGFMIACCWCSNGKKSSANNKRSNNYNHSSRSSNARPSSRSRSNHRDSSDTDWLALSARDSSNMHGGTRAASRLPHSAQYNHNNDRRRRHGGRGGGQRSRHSNSSGHHSSSHNYSRSRSVPPSLRYESTCHPCLRTFFSSNLFVVLLLISFFAVCAFVTNEYANNGVKQLPKAFNQSLDELQVYLNNTDYEVDNLLRVNYNQLENEINLRLDTAGMIIKQKLAVSSEAIALSNLTDIVVEFNDTKSRLERLDRDLTALKSKLTTAKKLLLDLRVKFENCPPDQCQLLRKRYQYLDNFKILTHYEKLPDVKHLIKKVTQLIESGIVNQVQKGKEDFDKYATFIQREVNGTTPDIKIQLALVGKRLSSLASDFTRSSKNTNDFFKSTKSSAKILDQYTEYELYRRYACLGGASVILFILLCYALGWLFGSCRPQPTARTYKTRVKTSASASFPFSCGIVTVFLIFLPMILAAIGLFLTGSVGDKIVCRVIKHPEHKQSKQIYAMLQNKFLDSSLPLDSTEQDFVIVKKDNDGKDTHIYRPNFADLVARCHQNQSIFKVLKLDKYDKLYITPNSVIEASAFNSIPEFKKANNIDAKLKELIKHLDLDTSRITLLNQQAEEILKNSMSLSFDDIEASFARLYDNNGNISPIDIEQLAKDINAQKAAINNVDIEGDLSLSLILATTLNDQLLPNITSSLYSLKDGVRQLKLRMFHGRNSFGTVITELIAKLRSAERQLRNDGRTLIKLAANEFIDELNVLIDQYTSHVKNQVENVIGQCEPVSRALNSTTSTLCDDIILPFNGYWLSIAASLILIIPATFFAYALKGLYQLAKRGSSGGMPHPHHGYSYTDQEDEISYEDDNEEIALAYHLGNHNLHHLSKPSSSSAIPSAPAAGDDGWSPSAPSYVHNSRPPPYAV